MTGRLMGIDHGIKRIGVAVSDASRLVAREVEIIHRKSKREDFERLNALAAQEAVVGYVIGMPNNEAPEGVHTQADTVRLWIERFKETTELPVVEWDEQLTSEDAHDLAAFQRRKYATPIDDLAARVMLQSFLDALRDGLATFPQRP
jgi:putative Holliday junction resolvase